MILTTIAAMISASLIIDEGARNAPLILLSDQVYSRVAAGLSLNQAAIIPIVLGSLAMVIHSGRSWLNRNRGLAVKVVAVTSILVLIAQPTLISHMLPSNEKDEVPPIFVKAERRYSGRECLTCHIQATPVLFQQWNSSRHASSGVLCDACHGSDHDALIWPTGEQCRRCHAAQVEEFNSGKHHLAWVAMVPVVEILKLDESTVVKGCGLCHRIGSSGNTTNWGPNTPGVANTPGSKCDVCHTRHVFSVVEARKPEACSNCHMGFDHPAYEMYIGSKHGIIYSTRGGEYNWTYPYNERWPNQAPVCITCHMDRGDHEVITAYGFYGILGPGVGPLKNDTEWSRDNAEVLKALGVLTPEGQPGVLFEYAKNMRVARLSDEEFERLRTEKMETCYRCHSRTYIDEQFRHYEAVTKNSIHLLAEGVRIVADLYKDGIVMKPESYPYNYPFMLAFYNSPTPIEQDLYLMLEEWHNRMFMGAFHQSADYMHWEGFAPMKEHLVRMRAEAELMRQTQPSRPAERGLPIPEVAAAVATVIALAAIVVAVRAERKIKRTTS
ncbi:MAG: multiheme c-type cytochrome [Candidatus Bathyarchaeia archaeon]